MLDMMLQSWGGIIHVFPAMPTKWQDASFYQLRTEGAFLVSALRKTVKQSLYILKVWQVSPVLFNLI